MQKRRKRRQADDVGNFNVLVDDAENPPFTYDPDFVPEVI